MEGKPRHAWPARVIGICLVLSLACSSSAQNQNLKTPAKTACLWLSVVDPLNRQLIGLPKGSFRVFEDGIEQTITNFRANPEDVPISLGVIWDVSRSRNGGENYEGARALVSRLLRARLPEAEYFLINFSESAPIQQVAGKMPATDVQIDTSQKRIALFDAIDVGLARIRQSTLDRRAIIIISDGEETYSKHTASEIRKNAQESDVRIYGIMSPGPFTDAIRDVAGATGGRLYAPNNFLELGYYVDLALTEFRSQYQLCYTPTNSNHDGTWRKIAIKLNPPPKLPKLTVYARKERFVPKD